MTPPLAAAAHHSFWTSTGATVLIVGACALVVGATIALMLARRSRPGSVLERVGEFISSPGSAVDQVTSPEEPSGGLLARTERSLERERWWDELKEKLEIARIDRPAIEIVYLTGAGSLGAAFVLGVLTGNVLAALVGLALPPLIARWQINRRLQHQRNLFSDQLPGHLEELAAAMRAGHSMVTGIGAVTEGASEPSRGEFRRVLAEEQLGMQLDDALRVAAGRMTAKDMEQVSLVAELSRQTGGNMAEVLDRVAESVRARAELNRELRTLTAQARGSRWVVTLIPPALLVVVELINPKYLEPLFSTTAGHALLILAVVMIAVGSLVMGRIVRIEV